MEGARGGVVLLRGDQKCLYTIITIWDFSTWMPAIIIVAILCGRGGARGRFLGGEQIVHTFFWNGY